MCLTIYFKHFAFINNCLESSSIKAYLVDFSFNCLIDSLMFLNILYLTLEILKFYSSRLILINSQPSSFSIAFCLCIVMKIDINSIA